MSKVITTLSLPALALMLVGLSFYGSGQVLADSNTAIQCGEGCKSSSATPVQ